MIYLFRKTKRFPNPRQIFKYSTNIFSILIAVCFLLSACGGGSGGSKGEANTSANANPPVSNTNQQSQPSAFDAELKSLATDLGLSGDPATPRSLAQIRPDDDNMVKLGQILFFSQTLSGGYDVSCGTCHHPDFGMGDGLSLGVGVAPLNSSAVGPGREVDQSKDLDPSTDGGPNMFRNSLTTLNTALHDRVLLLDGRFRVVDSAIVPGGHGQEIKTPESGTAFDADPVSGLLAFQAKGPMATDNEMRGFLFTEYATGSEYRNHLVRRLKGEVDSEYNALTDGPVNWLTLFRNAFEDPDGTMDELITMPNIQLALGKYSESQIFIDTPWKQYLDGDISAISEDAKEGATIFFKNSSESGLGCANCHGGDRFTDEQFYNVGFPQLGRGFGRADTSDFGRWLTTREEQDISAFRSLSLLNVAITGPWGHAGSFSELEGVLRYHSDPRSYVESYDFSLSTLQQFIGGNTSYTNAEQLTRNAIAEPSFDVAEAFLPSRPLTNREVHLLTAFLDTLTDDCAADPNCISQWTPDVSEDPDGHLLVRDKSLAPPEIEVTSVATYPKQIPMSFPGMAARVTFADVENCSDSLGTSINSGQAKFSQRTDASFGLNDAHGYKSETWFKSQSWVEVVSSGGGVTSTYLDDDCWPDLIFTGGDKSGMRFYKNVDGNYFESLNPLLTGTPEKEFTGAAVADLNGDYRREVMFGNIIGQEVPVYSPNSDSMQQYDLVAAIPMIRPTFGISFAPLDDSGYPYFYFSHWNGGSGVNGASPSLWRNEGTSLKPWDEIAKTGPNDILQSVNFTPKFVDLTDDGKLDLLIASDFATSSSLRNISTDSTTPLFKDDTNRNIITDENGMGSTLIDIDNDGNLEWFVTSIYETESTNIVLEEGPFGQQEQEIPVNWGQSGNRLYRNTSTSDQISFEDITTQAGVRNGYWGWGACAADFNNDGFSDIYHVNGYLHIPDEVLQLSWHQEKQQLLDQVTGENFQEKPSLLYINNGDGTFDDQATNWSIDTPSEGRGLTCFDFDRDGDVDIALFDHSTGMQFFENQIGNSNGKRFLSVRVVGEPPNTDAIGTKVYVTANIGGSYGSQTQLRLSEANSNFNSQNIPDLHFGLGSASIVNEIRIEWHGGEELTCSNIAANQFIVIDQREGAAACPN